jgi:hypothetical protein
MNSSNSRWVREVTGAETAVTPDERTALAELLAAIRKVRHGSVHITLQDSRVVQIETTEKKRL